MKKELRILLICIIILFFSFMIGYNSKNNPTGLAVSCGALSVDDISSYSQEYLDTCCIKQSCEGIGECINGIKQASCNYNCDGNIVTSNSGVVYCSNIGTNPSNNQGQCSSQNIINNAISNLESNGLVSAITEMHSMNYGECAQEINPNHYTCPKIGQNKCSSTNKVWCCPPEGLAGSDSDYRLCPGDNVIESGCQGKTAPVGEGTVGQCYKNTCDDDVRNIGKNGDEATYSPPPSPPIPQEPIGASCELNNKRNMEQFGECCYTIHLNIDEPGPKEYACRCYYCYEGSQCPDGDSKTERRDFPRQNCIPKLSDLSLNFNLCPPTDNANSPLWNAKFTEFCGVRDSNNKITAFYDCCDPGTEECKLEQVYGYCKPLPPLLPPNTNQPTTQPSINPNNYKCPKLGQHMCQVNNELWCCPPGGLGSLGPSYSYQLCPGQGVGGICPNEKAPTGLGTIGKCYLKQCGRSSKSINGDRAIKK